MRLRSLIFVKLRQTQFHIGIVGFLPKRTARTLVNTATAVKMLIFVLTSGNRRSDAQTTETVVFRNEK